MKKPAAALNEKLRIEILHSLNILDTASEERFDRLTRLAKKMFNVPIAIVSLVDSDRQWFKSCFGLPVRETKRDISFCGHTILGDDAFVINNTLEDERFFDNPLVLNEPNIRFYAGVPLYYSEDIKLGTLCLIDNKPREFTNEDIESLKDLALLAQQELIATQLATLDELTKISNRRGFNLLANKSLNICYREKIPAVLVFMDLNKFKEINDKYGHEEGDNTLKLFSLVMQESFRDSDVFARLGGDEFIVLLTHSDVLKAQRTIDRFRQKLNEKFKDLKYQLSFSPGMIDIDLSKETTLDELIKQADRVMYGNKAKD